MRTILPVASLASVAALAVGCGGGDDALSQSEFTKQGNAVCAKLNAEVKKIPEPQSLADIAKYADQLDGKYDDLISGLEGLTPPEDKQADFDKLIGTAKDAKGTVGELKSAAEKNDEKALQEVTEQAETKDQASDELARKVGLNTCAES